MWLHNNPPYNPFTSNYNLPATTLPPLPLTCNTSIRLLEHVAAQQTLYNPLTTTLYLHPPNNHPSTCNYLSPSRLSGYWSMWLHSKPPKPSCGLSNQLLKI